MPPQSTLTPEVKVQSKQWSVTSTCGELIRNMKEGNKNVSNIPAFGVLVKILCKIKSP